MTTALHSVRYESVSKQETVLLCPLTLDHYSTYKASDDIYIYGLPS